MTRHILISIILSLLFLVQTIAQSTTISGEIKNPNFYSITFQWEKDLVSGIVKESIIALNGANEFRSIIEIDEPSVIHIRYGSATKDIFLEPGDDLKINFDANQFDYSFSFSGKGKENNKLLDNYGKEFGKYNENFFIFEMAHKNPQEYRSYMNNVHKEMLAFYQKNSFGGITYSFRSFLKSEIDYKWAYNLLRYRFENPKANLKPGPIVLPNTYYTFLDEVKIQNRDGLKNKYYHKFISEYLQYRKDRSSEALKKFSVRVESNSLTLRNEPKTGERITVVNKGDVLEYLEEKSTVTSEVFTRGKQMDTPWIKVRTSIGQIGWIIEGGVDVVRSADDPNVGNLAESGKYNNAGKYLEGEVLEFHIASELHKSVNNPILPYDKSDFEAFINTAKNPIYKSSVQNDYKKKFGTDTLVNQGASIPNSNSAAQNNPIAKPSPIQKTTSNSNLNIKPKRVTPRSTNYVVGIPKNTELRGKVSNPTSKTVEVVFYQDKFSFEEKSLKLKLTPNNEFDLTFDISEPTTAKLIYGNSVVEIFVEPGDELEMAFDGKSLKTSIVFTGKSGEQNNFLTSFNNEFSVYDDDHVYHEIVNKQPSRYRSHLDEIRSKKWKYLQQYDIESKKQFSRGFSQFISAEIDYWWAYNLLRYHWEHPAANGLAYPMKIEGNYYNFLGKVLISNDNAISSKSYLSFLSLYLKLREDNPDANILYQIKQGTYKSIVHNEEVMNNPGGTTSITVLFSGEKVKYLNVKSPNTSSKLVNGIMKTDYWYQISTNDGYIGWVFGAAGTLNGVEGKNSSINKKYKRVEEEKEIVTTVAIVKVDRLRIRKEPDLPSALGLANEGNELIYLGRKSSQRFTFNLRGESHNDYFYKIETADGKIGWVFGGGIELEERRSKQKIYKTVPIKESSTSQSGSTEMYLSGRALYYTKASDIYWKCKGSKPDEIKEEVDRFINSNPYNEYDVAIQEAYDDALRREYKTVKVKDNSAALAAEKAKLDKIEAEKKRKEEEAARLAKIAEEKRIADVEATRLAKIEADKKKAADDKIRLERIAEAEGKREAARLAEKKRKEEEAARLAKIAEEKRIANAEAARLKELADAEAAAKAKEAAERLAEEERLAKAAAALAAEKAKEAEDRRIEEERLAGIAEAKRLEEELKEVEKQARIQAKVDAKEAKRLAKIEAARIKEEERLAKIKEKEDARIAAMETVEVNPNPIETPAVPAQPIEEVKPAIIESSEPSEYDKCVLDGISLGLMAEDAEKQCKEIWEKIEAKPKPQTGIIKTEITEGGGYTPETKKNLSGSISPAELLQMIDLTPIDAPKSDIQFNGKISGHRNKTAKVILYPDPVSMKEVTYNLYIKPDGSFATKLSITEPTIGKFEYGSRIMELFIQPGDQINVDFEANDFLTTLKFSGQGGENNNFLKELRTDFTNQDKECRGKLYSETNPKAYKKFLKKIHNEKMDYYDLKSASFSYEFAQYAKANIDYWFAYNMTNYRWENPLNFNQPSPMKIRDASFYDFQNEIQLNNEWALPNEYYAQYLDVYLDDKTKEPGNKGLTKVELADIYFTGKSKYFYQAKILASSARNGQLTEVIFDIKTFMDFCPFQPYKESIKTALRESKTLLPGMPAPDFELVDINGKTVHLSDFKGKVVYLDFWATWCTPCTRQISNTTEMRRKFAGRDMVFIYVSTDYTESEWRNYVTRHNITGVHLFAKGELNSSAALDYGVKQLPAAFIIDKKGEIVKNNSMKNPSNYSLTEQLSKLLLAN